MSDKSEHDAEADRKSTRRGSQFNLRGMLYLTAAFALWLVVLPDLRSEPIAVAIFWTLAIIAGVCGHLMYTYLLPWRGTVVTSLIVLSVTIFAAVATLFGAGDGVIDILALPIDLFVHQSWSNRIWFTFPVFACILILLAAHPIKPGLINAIITAIGVSLWYGLAILIAANAG